MRLFSSIIVLLFMLFFVEASAQKIVPVKDSVTAKKALPKKEFTSNVKDTSKIYSPRIAIRRSAILPGWGQVTNHRTWKVPIIYGALGTTTFLFFRNLNQYKEARDAYKLATDNDPNNDYLIKQPYFNVKDQPQRILSYRNSVRQNVDYSVLFFIIFWGLNVADAAVDANLKTFDVSDDLSLKIKPGYSPMAKTAGLSLVLNIGK